MKQIKKLPYHIQKTIFLHFIEDLLLIKQKHNFNWIRCFDLFPMFQKDIVKIVEKYEYKLNWYVISFHIDLSESFIRAFQDKVNWWNISRRQELSESFIREFQDKVHWDDISWRQTLSEEFISEFKDRVNWSYISRYQNLNK